jgi:hypothetical protein
VEITAALAADLAILSLALDEGDTDIVEALRRLVADAKSAVSSYLGLTVTADHALFPLTLTVMEDSAHPGDIATSLLLPLSDDSADGGVPVAVILYAARSGAFIDLAADLCWLTGRQLTDFSLDRHLNLPAEPVVPGSVQGSSLVNQAIGVLLGRGYTPEQAELEIDARAAAAGHSRSKAASLILSNPQCDDVDPTSGTR